MNAPTTARPAAPTPAARVLALATTEVRLVLRNRTVAISSVLVPLALGLFWAFSFGAGDDPAMQAVVVALQLAVVLGMGIYVTTAVTVVARRHCGVLKRLRTSGLSDRGLLLATVTPSIVLGILQMAIFAGVNAATGAPAAADPVPMVLAAVGGVVLVVMAGLATTVVTATPERAQITTLPLTFVLLGAGIVMTIAPPDGWLQALLVLPGAAIGPLVQLSFTGQTWAPGLGGLPAALPSIVALVVWTVLFAVAARRWFRWDPRS